MQGSRDQPDGDRLHVLVVDDSEIVLELTRQWLVEAGYRVSTRSEAMGTAAELLQLRPDIALIDVLMPGLQGDELARLLKRHPATRGVAVILYSSLETDELRPLIMQTSALGAIRKTSDQALFTFTFNHLVAKRWTMFLSLKDATRHSAVSSSGSYPVDTDDGAEARHGAAQPRRRR